MQNTANFLRNIPLFSSLSPNELEEIYKNTPKRSYPKGSIVLYKGDKGESIYLIIKGKVKVIRTTKKEQGIGITTLDEGNYFGEMSIFDKPIRSATIMTIEPCEFIVISKEIVKNQIEKKPDIAFELLSEMSRRLREAGEQIAILSLHDIRDRVLLLLSKLSEDAKDSEDGNYRIIYRPTMKELASMCGSTRETVSRILNNFKEQGLINMKKREIVIYKKIFDDQLK